MYFLSTACVVLAFLAIKSVRSLGCRKNMWRVLHPLLERRHSKVDAGGQSPDKSFCPSLFCRKKKFCLKISPALNFQIWDGTPTAVYISRCHTRLEFKISISQLGQGSTSLGIHPPPPTHARISPQTNVSLSSKFQNWDGAPPC